MVTSLKGRRVWVTGASRGLGRVVAEDLCRGGARVALTARADASLEEVHAACGPDVSLRLPGSVASEADVARIVDAIRRRWGGLDALVHFAGVSPVYRRADELDPRVWREIIDINLTGTFLACQGAASVMTTGGSIVTVSSIHAQSASRKLAAYSASKGGVEALTRALALDWADRNIRVNSLALGYFETEMTQDFQNSEYHRERILRRVPLGRFGKPSQIVEIVRLLVGAADSYITGSVLTFDGGWKAA